MAKLCDVVGSGWLFPMSQFEVDLPPAIKVVIYGVLLVYFFLGVAIVSDIFMSAIEEITSRRYKVLFGTGVRTPKVWNDTVATLSLMALGSSAPEIFLAVVEIFKKEFHIGPLGTSTIVGSAAFNLLMIISVCMVVIPTGENRIIKDLPAFYITAVFSIFAYAWLAVIVLNDTVDWWEALLTLCFLPLLIYVSYIADVGALDGLWTRLHLMISQPREASKGPAARIAFVPQVDFVQNSLIVFESDEAQKILVSVACNGAKGAKCQFRTEKLTAVPGYHWVESDGELEFSSDTRDHNIEIEICRGCSEIDRDFLIILSEPEGAQFDADGNGGTDECILLVTIRPPADIKTFSQVREKSQVATVLEAKLGSVSGVRRVMDEWKDQLTEALYCGGSAAEQKEASNFDFICHLIAMPWKVLFSCAPPLFLGQGWARFAWSLFGIACMTMMISDLAELFGCVFDIPDICTALVFVALGTSMPDLFASLSAAKEDPTADASIVNVTGSNSVNVFLGVGVPYLIAAIHWETKGEKFIVKTDGLVFSIICFCCVCVGGLFLLYARRQLVGAELGGPNVPKFVCGLTFVLFWVAFVGMSSWRVLKARGDGVSSSEELVAVLALGGVVVLLTTLTCGVLLKYRVDPQEDESEGLEDEAGQEEMVAQAKVKEISASDPAPLEPSLNWVSPSIPAKCDSPKLIKALSRSLSSLSGSSGNSPRRVNPKSPSGANSPHPEDDGELQGPTPVLLQALSRSLSGLADKNNKAAGVAVDDTKAAV